MAREILDNTELLRVTVDDLDGETAEPVAPVNILREKTFNPELSSLLGKIYSHEKVATSDLNEAAKYEPSVKITLLQKCDDLIYRIKHEEEAATVTSDFNPFSLDINVYDDIDDLNDYIRAGLKQCGFSRFLIMEYSFRDAAFRTELNILDDRLSADLFFSVRDPFFIQLCSSDQGSMIEYETVHENPFMSKKLGSLFEEGNSRRDIFVIRLCSVARDFNLSAVPGTGITPFERYLSPILVVIPDDDSEKHTASWFYEKLQRKIQIPISLYLMRHRFTFNSTELNYGDALLMLELFVNSPSGREMPGSILTLENFSSKENLFIFKYLISRIRKSLDSNSFFMRISINKCILITSEEEMKDISGIVDEINLSERIIDLYSYAEGLNLDRNSFASLFL